MFKASSSNAPSDLNTHKQKSEESDNDVEVFVGDYSQYFQGYIVTELIGLYDALDEDEKSASSGAGHRSDDYIDKTGNEYQDDEEGNTYIFL